MAKTIIVPLAGPERDPERVGELALPVARALAAHHGATIVLMSVVEIAASFEDTEGTVDEALAREHEAYLQRVDDTVQGVRTQRTIRQDTDVADQVRRVAEETPDPIVVMASHCHRGLRRTALGSVAFEVVRSIRFPVVVVPATAAGSVIEQPRLGRVLVPIEDASDAEATIAAMLRVLDGHALDVHLTGTADSSGERQTSHDSIAQRLEAFAERLADAGHRVTWDVRAGDAEEQIVRAAEDFDAGVIAMATHGRTGIERIVLGSVAESVLRHSGRPVILTRLGETQQE